MLGLPGRSPVTHRRNLGSFGSALAVSEECNGPLRNVFLAEVGDTLAGITAGRTSPSCVAQELAKRCLLDLIKVAADTYELELDPNFRGLVTE
jgi:hypothetical protein